VKHHRRAVEVDDPDRNGLRRSVTGRYGSVEALADLKRQAQLRQFVRHGDRTAASFLDPA
jgi:hypothetical protein